MSKRKRKRKHKICYDCENCQYIGEGDSICDLTFEIVLADWTPTGNFMQCQKSHKLRKEG